MLRMTWNTGKLENWNNGEFRQETNVQEIRSGGTGFRQYIN
jgi:hypothetical protein